MRDDELEVFVRQLRSLLAERKMDQSELAHVAEINPAQITRYIKGERRPTLRTMEKLAEALQVDPIKLFPGYAQEKAKELVAEAIAKGWLDLLDIKAVIEGHRYQRSRPGRAEEGERQ
ncbi:MAG: helix-turn-helix transcriptional regulator [Thermoleophilia bacterium]|nr:helix-turn-helix transcriptional regulator [Thermoleophilia bacterium]